ncbi:hypothetical protein WJX77_006396 [Trebouxia sp. C0004]
MGGFARSRCHCTRLSAEILQQPCLKSGVCMVCKRFGHSYCRLRIACDADTLGAFVRLLHRSEGLHTFNTQRLHFQ